MATRAHPVRSDPAGSLAAEADRSDPRISPAREPDLAALAPTVLAVAQYDPLRDQGAAYAEALAAAGVPVTFHPGRGLIHGSYDMLGVSPAGKSELEQVLASVGRLLSDRSIVS
jgi:acetyl esterase